MLRDWGILDDEPKEGRTFRRVGQSAFEAHAASGVDERNGTERILGEPQSDGRALYPTPSET